MVRYAELVGEGVLIIGWPIPGSEIIVKDEKEIFERASHSQYPIG
jgi:hypothetical protein